MWSFLYIFLSIWTVSTVFGEEISLTQGEAYIFNPANHKDKFQIYCYAGRPKNILHLWQTVTLQINHPSDNYVQYDGPTVEAVQKEYQDHKSTWRFNIFSWKSKDLRLEPFNQSCVGIESQERYKIKLTVIRIDYWKVLSLIGGILLFVSAKKLSQNVVFYYLCGISIGIGASFLILIYFISRLFPKKPMMYGIAATGWTVGIYLLQVLWENVRTIMVHYKSYLIWYTIVSAVVSFIACYRWGTVENERTRNIIKWSLQFLSLVLIFISTEYQEAAVGQIILIVLFNNIPAMWLSKGRAYWARKFPPKIKLITNDEYYEQGVRETNKALSELREFCSSPKCNQWKTALKLKDVKRFASFVEGSSHLSDDEILEYETSMNDQNISDNEVEMELTDED